jgi:hypothetical protein
MRLVRVARVENTSIVTENIDIVKLMPGDT